MCHEGNEPDGPLLTGTDFVDRWREDRLSSLLTHIRTEMPGNEPGKLSEPMYVDILAFLLEANGIPTVVMGCAKDIVEHAAVPRFLFSDFPLGNSAGKPHDAASQELTLELALRLLESATGARTTMQSPLRWSEDASWKLDYNNVAQLSPEELARRRAEFDKQKEIARGNRAA